MIRPIYTQAAPQESPKTEQTPASPQGVSVRVRARPTLGPPDPALFTPPAPPPSPVYGGLDLTPAIHITRGSATAPILVVCDPPSQQAWRQMLPMGEEALNMFLAQAREQGLTDHDFCFVRLCPPIKTEDDKSDARKWTHVKEHVPTLIEFVRMFSPRLVVTLGSLASRAIIGSAVAITKARGTLLHKEGLPAIFPLLSPSFIQRVPEHEPTMRSDMLTLAKLRRGNFDPDVLRSVETDYQWRCDISDFLGENKPRVMAVDTETTGGLHHWRVGHAPFLFQFSPRPGQTLCCPIDRRYFRKVFPNEPEWKCDELKRQVQELVEDPAVRMIGHNIKYDHHALRVAGMTPRGWQNDTLVMAFQCDENMMDKSLDQCVRTWVPEMAGYADAFNSSIDKANMIDVPPEVMLPYAGGDPDAVMRLARVLWEQLMRDPGQMNCYQKIQRPALMMFGQVTEKYGVRVDDHALEDFSAEVDAYIEETYNALIRQVPAAVRRKHIDWAAKNKKTEREALNFGRADFVKDVLFSADGFGLTPVVFTESTKDLPDPSMRQPSVSSKDHMPYFVTHPQAGDFVTELIEYVKAEKIASTYTGKRQEGTGFWKYIDLHGDIHPSFALHKTNTGRTASSDPNGQNFPKRGRWAKGYAKIFKARAGYRLVASDMSQIELRLIAWEANEPRMLEVYRAGGDIHASTAAIACGVPFEQFMSWKSDERLLLDCANEIPGSGAYLQSLNPGARREAKVKDFFKLQRFRAKAVNFGFVYGASAPTFRTYAKTNYGVDYTEAEARLIRERYFGPDGFSTLPTWHGTRKAQARKYGFVRALHGAMRRLPSIYSNDRGMRASAERQAVNAPIQRFGSDLCLIGATRFQAQVNPELARVVLTIHDQVVLEVREGYEEEMAAALCWCMQNPPLESWFGIRSPLPFGSDAEIGDNLGEMEERADIEPVKPDWWNDDEDAVMKDFMLGVERQDLFVGRLAA